MLAYLGDRELDDRAVPPALPVRVMRLPPRVVVDITILIADIAIAFVVMLVPATCPAEASDDEAEQEQ